MEVIELKNIRSKIKNLQMSLMISQMQLKLVNRKIISKKIVRMEYRKNRGKYKK